MPTDKGMEYTAEARCDLEGWPEAMPMGKANAKTMANFLITRVFIEHGLPGILVVDGGPENKGVLTDLCQRYSIRKVVMSVYNARANGTVKNSHLSIFATISKTLGDKGKG